MSTEPSEWAKAEARHISESMGQRWFSDYKLAPIAEALDAAHLAGRAEVIAERDHADADRLAMYEAGSTNGDPRWDAVVRDARLAGVRAGLERAARSVRERGMMFGVSTIEYIELDRAERDIRAINPEDIE